MFKVVISSAGDTKNLSNLCVEKLSKETEDGIIKFTIYPDESGEFQNSVVIDRTDLIKALDFLFSK
jgi:hypothetical protein